MSRPHCRAIVASLAVLCICLSPLVAPCGETEPSFDRSVRDHLVRNGYLNPLDVLEPFDATSDSDRCRLARAPRNCSCVAEPDRIAAASRLRA